MEDRDALVEEADELLNAGRSRDAAGPVTRLRVAFPESPETLRLVQRLKISTEADRYWQSHGDGSSPFALVFQDVLRPALGFLCLFLAILACWSGVQTMQNAHSSEVEHDIGGTAAALGAIFAAIGFRLLKRGSRT